VFNKVVTTKIIVVLGIMLLGLTTSASAAQQKIKIVWWNDYTEPSQIKGGEEYIIKPFEAAHPNIKLEIEAFTSTEIERIMRTAVGTGGGPDIITLSGPVHALTYVDANTLVPLDKYAKKFNWDKKIFRWALDVGRYKNHLWDIPLHYETMVLWYNQTMFEEMGWDLPTDWDSLVSLCEKQSAAGIIPFAWGTADYAKANSWMYGTFFNYVAGPKNFKKALLGEMKLTDEPFKKAIGKYYFLWQRGYFSNKQSQALSLSDAWGLWQNRKAAMKIEGTWAFGQIGEYSKGFTYNWAPIPQLEPGVKPPVAIGIGSCVAVNANSKHPDEAAAVIDFLFSDPELAAKRIEAYGGELWVPMEISKKYFPPTLDKRIIRAITWIGENMAAGNIGYLPWTFVPPRTHAQLWGNLDRVLLNKMSVEEYLANAQKVLDQDISEGNVPPIP